MDLSVVIPTRDQKERLRLVLCALERQTLAPDRFCSSSTGLLGIKGLINEHAALSERRFGWQIRSRVPRSAGAGVAVRR